MDIGVPYRDLGPIETKAAAAAVRDLPDDAWHRNAFRQEILAHGVHAATRAILFRHEWARWDNPWNVNTMEELVHAWAKSKPVDPTPFLPVAREETDMGPVYTFAEWGEFKDALQPVVDAAIAALCKASPKPGGIVTRLALVWLGPGGIIAPHDDGQAMAAKAHRLHVPLITPPGVEYKLGGKKLVMRQGRVYDFNNRIRHSVRHKGKRPRVNLFIDYYPDPGVYVPPAYGHH